MRLTLTTRYKSLDGEICAEELPDFVVVCGLNGSGKTNLLEGINGGTIKVDGLGESSRPWNERAQWLPVTRLENASTAQTMAERSETFVDLHRAVEHQKAEYAKADKCRASVDDEPESCESFVRDNLVANGLVTRNAITRMVGAAGKSLVDFEIADFARLGPLTARVHEMFSLKLGELFVRYRDAFDENDFRRYKDQFRKDPQYKNSWLDDEPFAKFYGPPPWVLLNQVVEELDLNFEFLPPPPRQITDQVPAEISNRRWPIKMRDKATGEPVEPNWLSSGEKTALLT